MQTPALCSRLSAQRGLPLIGSAGCYDRVLAFELESPWTPRLVGSRSSGGDLDAAIADIGLVEGLRLLALEPRGHSTEGRRVLSFSRSPGPFGAYDRREFVVARDRLGQALRALARLEPGQAPGGGAIEQRPSAADESAPLRDILVCTHGARDACCAKFGYPTYVRLEELAARRGNASGRLRIWRSSHLGGHRFAPTLLDLPSGRMFGRLEADDAEAVLEGGQGLLERLARIYRGRCALPEEVQIVEQRLWEESGAEFEGALLTWRSRPVDGASGQWTVGLEADAAVVASAPDAPRWRSAARVVRDDVDAVSTPASCGRDPEAESPWRILP